MKKILALLTSILMVLSFVTVAFAAQTDEAEKVLKFDENGEFKIFNICDMQDNYPLHKTTAAFVKDMIKIHHPDLVILGGDNTISAHEDKQAAVKEICELFVETETYFTLVFGNHDFQQGYTNDELLAMYQQYGGKYCLAYDAEPALTGAGTHNLTVLSSDGSKIAYNLYMFDSNSRSDKGYDCVHEDQIEWYKNTSLALKQLNGGEVVPAMAFQHIIVQEVYEELFVESPFNLGELTRNYDGLSYTYLPITHNIKDGFLLEAPCPGYYNYGQFDAFVETGDIVAVFSGHDHTNSFTVTKDGIDIVNTPGLTYHSYGNDANRGIRMITLNENNTSVYETEILTVADYVLSGDGRYLTEYGDISLIEAFFGKFAEMFMNMYVNLVNLFFMFA